MVEGITDKLTVAPLPGAYRNLTPCGTQLAVPLPCVSPSVSVQQHPVHRVMLVSSLPRRVLPHPHCLTFLSWWCHSVCLSVLCSDLCPEQPPGSAWHVPTQSCTSLRHLGCVRAISWGVTNSRRAVDCVHQMPSCTLPSEQCQVPVTSGSLRLQDNGES